MVRDSRETFLIQKKKKRKRKKTHHRPPVPYLQNVRNVKSLTDRVLQCRNPRFMAQLAGMRLHTLTHDKYSIFKERDVIL